MAGCSTQQAADAVPISQAWHRAQADSTEDVCGQASVAPPAGGPVALVDGQPIEREQLMRLLLAGRGAEVLEGLIALELARREACAIGLTVTAEDVESEYDEALRALLNQLPADDETALDRKAGERLLGQVLASRGVCREEYRLGLLRNAYLRKLALQHMQLSEQELGEEFTRAYGERVSVRHIQLAGAGDVERVKQALEAGADFADLARRHSANTITAPSGGLLQPFSKDDPGVPALLGEAAFSLEPGQVSNAVRVGNWYHVLRLERRLPAADVAFDQVRTELQARLRDRRLPAEMQRISADLFDRAGVEILDPVLEAEFSKRLQE
ncbi:MAG: peptidylprolyl isomerase [Planctomycetota bacterium]|jgi:parvulin-like peptidyl-prolyl isomerase